MDNNTVKDLQDQVREHIKQHDLFDWNEALTGEEMTYLENLLLTFMPIVPPGSIGYEKLMKAYEIKQPPTNINKWIEDAFDAGRNLEYEIPFGIVPPKSETKEQFLKRFLDEGEEIKPEEDKIGNVIAYLNRNKKE